jgi:hypothetical protein
VTLFGETETSSGMMDILRYRFHGHIRWIRPHGMGLRRSGGRRMRHGWPLVRCNGPTVALPFTVLREST